MSEQPRRLHALSPFLSLFERPLLAAPAAIALGRNGLRLLVAGLAVLLAARVIRWWRSTWVLTDGVLRIESGVFARRQQLVRCDRIQQVTIVQKLRQRLFGVASLRVEVAGATDGGGVELEVLALDEATRLREALLAAKATTPVGTAAEAPAWVPAPWPVVELDFAQLALAGVTGGQLLVVFALAASLLQFADDLPGRPLQRVDEIDVGPIGPVLTALLVLVFVALWLGSAVGASILRDGGYRLSLVGQELHLSRGLLDRKEAVLPLARVQAVRVSASPLRRALGYVSLRLQGAGSGTDQEERRLFVPLLSVDSLERVLGLVLPGLGPLPALVAPPRAALRRSVVRCASLPSVAAVVLALVVRPWGTLALGLIPLGLALGVAAYRSLGHGASVDVVVARRGALVRQTTVVPVVRTQSVRVRSSPFQRRAGLATVLVDLAGPGAAPRVIDVSAATASALGHRVTAAAGAGTVTSSAR